MKVHLSKPVVITGLVVFVCFVALQALQPTLNNSPVAAEVKVPAEVKRILSKSCYNCHSNQTRLAWFDRIVPGYWLVASHVHAGRKVLNFSTLGAQPGPAQRAALFESVNQVRLGAMPPSSYAWLHGSEKLQPAELATLEEYLRDSTDLAPKPTPDSTGQKAPAVTQVRRAPNGIAFMPDYKTWELIGLTERFDNGTVRAVLGNRTAVEAARKGKVNPWPDGSALAKVAWSQNLVTPTVVEPGNFVQVELMIRDSQKFRKTEGWGWGRWRGADLTPYGEGPEFVNECIGCHRSMKDNDHVFTTPVRSAMPPRATFVTLRVDRARSTISALITRDGSPERTQMYTWPRIEDDHWFGAKVPAHVEGTLQHESTAEQPLPVRMASMP